jgi:hypothetical protein
MKRDEIIALVREHYDPMPKDWPRHRWSDWDDGTGEIADRILQMAPNPAMSLSECPLCKLKASSGLHRFCTRGPSECPLR